MVDKELTKAIVKTAILELDLEMTRSMNTIKDSVISVESDVRLLRQEIPSLISTKIKACQKEQITKKQWNIRTLFIVLGLMSSMGFSAYAVFFGG